jgi:hypothetical protein
MEFMEAHHIEYIGLALFVASELIGMNPKMRSNSVLQLLINAALRAFPYQPRGRR